MAFRTLRPLFHFILTFAALSASLQAGPVTLYLKDGTVVRGTISARSATSISVETDKGTRTLVPEALQPISQQQLRFDTTEEVLRPADEAVKVEAILEQMEKLLAENEVLKKRIVELETRLGKLPISDPTLPAEDPTP